jgi:hypothetical protein
MAATVVRGLVARIVDGSAMTAHLSLARTAKLLSDHKGVASELTMPPLSEADMASDIEYTSWRPARRLKPPAAMDRASMKSDRPATALGSGMPSWLR